MGLEGAIVPISFQGGLDTKTDYKQTVPGKFLVLQNAVRRKAGLWEKRYGFSSLSKSYVSATSSATGTLAASTHLAPYANGLVSLDGNAVYTYSPAQNVWGQASGAAPVVGVNTTPIGWPAPTNIQPDIAYANGYYGVLFCANDGQQGDAVLQVVDATTSAVVKSKTLTSFSNSQVRTMRVVGVGNYLVFFIGSVAGNAFLAWVYNTASPSSDFTNYTISASTLAGSTPFEVENVDGTACAFAYNNTSSGLTIGYFIPSLGALGNGINGYAAPVTIASGTTLATQAMSLCVGAGSRIFLAYFDSNTANSVKLTGYTPNLATSSTVTLVNVSNVRNLSMADSGNSNNALTILYEIGNPGSIAAANGQQVNFALATWTGSGAISVGTHNFLIGAVGLASKMVYTNANFYQVVAYDSVAQPSYFLWNVTTNTCIARLLSNEGGGLSKGWGLGNGGATVSYSSSLLTGVPRLAVGPNGVLSTILLKRTQLILNSSGAPVSLYTNAIRYDFALSGVQPTHAQLGSELELACGGMLTNFDSVYASEHGFHFFPENLSFSDLGAASGTTTGGTYAVRCTYQYTDGNGLLHESAPSPTQTVTLAAGHAASIFAPNLPFSFKPNIGEVESISLAFYVAPVNTSSLFYRIGTTSGFAGNTTPSVSVFNLTADPDTTQPILYATGGILENDCPPAISSVLAHKNRLWGTSSEDNFVAFTKEFQSGEGVAFSDAFRIPLESEGGLPRALGSLDDRLIILKADRLYYIVGEGPLATGQQWDYPEPIRIPSTVGTVYPTSVVETPSGLIFKSAKGWMLLTRNLIVTYIGAQVESFNSLVPTSAVYHSLYNEVRFTHSNGSTLVYNLDFNVWSEWTNYTAVGAALVNNTYYHIDSTGQAYAEVVGQYNDNGTTIDMAMETSWLSLARLQGFQRIYALELLGDWISDFHCKLSIAYDFHTAYNQVITIATTGLFTDVFQLRVQPALQKCTAIKLRIETIDDIVGGGGACFKPSALTVEVGRKRGAYRLPTNTTA
jgi:hypothetical protein